MQADDQVGAATGGNGVVWEAELRRLRQNERNELYEVNGSSTGGRSKPTTRGAVCVGCGGAIAPVLSRLGSTRCHDCRDGVATVKAAGSAWAAGPRARVSPAWAFLVRVRERQRRQQRIDAQQAG